MNQPRNNGYRDVPIKKLQEDFLDIGVYIDSLSEFILTCDTPMTIAIQGDWGSGKTSMMNMIREKIEDRVIPIWFNTWRYSQFDMQGDLAISLISHFANKIGANDNEKIKSALRGLSKLGKAIAIAGAKMAGVGEVAKAAVEHFENGTPDPSEHIHVLIENLESLVDAKLKEAGKDRVVVFIDDLDRLSPGKAVELLEVLKLFLDIPECVFVLAVDYNVVVQGLEMKFGKGVGEDKGKSFFDKIIQLPFTVPVAQYNVTKYISTLLERMNVEYTEENIAVYQDLINNSIGFNPRSIKRLFNSFLLLNNVAEKKYVYKDSGSIKRSDKQRILFATLCLQMAFDAVYRYMLHNIESIDGNFFKAITDVESFKNDTALAGIRREVKDNQDIVFFRISAFMETFYSGLLLDDKSGDISAAELNALKSMLSFSAITSTAKETVIVAGKTSADEFLKQCNSEDKRYFETIFGYLNSKDSAFKPKFGTAGFSIKGTVLCYPTSSKGSITFIRDKLTSPAQEFLQGKGGDLTKKRIILTTSKLSSEDLIRILDMLG